MERSSCRSASAGSSSCSERAGRIFMGDDGCSMAPKRREVLLAAAVIPLLLLRPRPGRATPSEPNPPLFGTGRSQFILERPRTPLPALKLQDMSGKDVTLAPKSGRVTLINLWATWCAACKTDLPTLTALDSMRIPR